MAVGGEVERAHTFCVVAQSNDFVHLLLIVGVDSQLASDLAEGQHVGCRGELEVHHVAVQVDVGGLVRQWLRSCD